MSNEPPSLELSDIYAFIQNLNRLVQVVDRQSGITPCHDGLVELPDGPYDFVQSLVWSLPEVCNFLTRQRTSPDDTRLAALMDLSDAIDFVAKLFFSDAVKGGGVWTTCERCAGDLAPEWDKHRRMIMNRIGDLWRWTELVGPPPYPGWTPSEYRGGDGGTSSRIRVAAAHGQTGATVSATPTTDTAETGQQRTDLKEPLMRAHKLGTRVSPLQAAQHAGRSTTVQPVRFPTPLNATWPDVEIRFVEPGGERVAIHVKKVTGIYTPIEMGMLDHRKKTPDYQWDLLKRLAHARTGVLTWDDRGADRNIKDRKKKLCARLREFFGLAGSPIFWDCRERGYRWRFSIEPFT